MDYRQRRETGTGWNARRTAGLGLILAVVVFFLPRLTMGGEPVLGLAQQGEGAVPPRERASRPRRPRTGARSSSSSRRTERSPR